MIDGGLRIIFRRHIPEADWQSIETGGVSRGVPDANYCLDGHEGWVEFKRTDGWTVPLGKEQSAWITRRVRHGGRVLVGVRQRLRGMDRLWVLAGSHARFFRAVGLPHSYPLTASTMERDGVLMVRDGGPSHWDWAAVRRCLVGETTSAPPGVA